MAGCSSALAQLLQGRRLRVREVLSYAAQAAPPYSHFWLVPSLRAPKGLAHRGAYAQKLEARKATKKCWKPRQKWKTTKK
eukprot:4554379-Amphidinium_carterae.1